MGEVEEGEEEDEKNDEEMVEGSKFSTRMVMTVGGFSPGAMSRGDRRGTWAQRVED